MSKADKEKEGVLLQKSRSKLSRKIDDEEREIEREWDKSSCVRRATKTFNLFVRLFVRFTK